MTALITPEALVLLGKVELFDTDDLEHPLAEPWIQTWADAGYHRDWLRVRYPAHRARSRLTRATDKCRSEFTLPWPGTGLAPQDAVRWFVAGMRPCCTERFAAFPLGPIESRAWQDAGFERPDEAQAWARRFFTPSEADAWSRAGVRSPVVAGAWLAEGLGPQRMLAWSWLWGGRRKSSPRPPDRPEPGREHLEAVVGWLPTGMPMAEVRLWVRAGATPAEALALPPGHPERPDRRALRVLAALRNDR